jgi:FAD/FMN-containing dehydrogenase
MSLDTTLDLNLDALRRALRGPVLTADDSGYAEESACFNVAVVHTPDVVVGAASADDVVAAVRWAAEHDLPVAVQATGHGASEAVREGVLITTWRMQGVHVDPERRIARVEAGVQWRTVLAEAVPHGLIGLCGSSSGVGVIGYTLGGGLPVLGRAFGYSADFVRSIDVVTPDGALHTATAEQEPELFEVLRGGKGNFGIVTALELELPAVAEFYGGGVMYPGSDAAEVLSAFRAWLPTLPDEACPSVALLRLPDAPFVPEPLRGQFVVHLRFAYPGSKEDGDRLLAPMRAVSHPLMDTAAPLSYEQIDLVNLDPADPLPFDEAGALLTDFDEAAQQALLEVAGPGVETPLLMIELRPLGGALGRGAAVPDAVTGRDAGFVVMALGLLVPPIADAVPAAVERLLDALRPSATGYTLVNFHGRPGDMADRARAWKPEIYDVIRRAKRRYDPTNMLRFGHAVVLPSGEPVAPALPL